MFTMLFKCLMMIRGVNISVGVFFVKGLIGFGVFLTRFEFLGTCATESRETNCTVACASKKR